MTGFLGPNGAGKTTTLRMVLGLISPDAGTATFNGDALRGAARARPARSGAVLETAFHPARTGRNHLRVYCRAAGLPLDPRRRGPRPGRARSDAGNRQRRRLLPRHAPAAGLATALLGDPAVLVLDEPANGLDPEGIQWLRGFLRHLAHDQGRTVLVSSHLLAEVEQTVDRVVIVGAGRLVRRGLAWSSCARAPTAPARVLVRSPRGGRARRACCAPAGTTVSHRRTATLTVTGLPRPRRSAAARSPRGIELHELRAHTSGLEEIYFQLTSGSEQFAAAARPGTTGRAQEGAR